MYSMHIIFFSSFLKYTHVNIYVYVNKLSVTAKRRNFFYEFFNSIKRFHIMKILVVSAHTSSIYVLFGRATNSNRFTAIIFRWSKKRTADICIFFSQSTFAQMLMARALKSNVDLGTSCRPSETRSQ